MKKQQPPKNRKSVLVGVIVLAIVTIVGLTIVSAVAVQQSKMSNSTKDHTSVVNLEGESICLPKKDTTGPQTAECASGIKVAEGVYYALANLQNQTGSEPVTTGDTVVVSGKLAAPTDNEAYNIAGTVNVRSIIVKQ